MRPSLLLVVLLAAQSFGQAPEEGWIDSPEAYFANEKERTEWSALRTRAERDAFKERYWLRRDPTPGTERNEFRETVFGRIQTADQRWTIAETAGSRTARGMAFILFGSPARVQQEHAPRLQRPCIPTAGGPPCPTGGAHEGNEVTEVWIYDRERTPRVLEALGRPSMELTVIVEPSRRSDRLQNPGLVNQYRALLAERTIVNPALVAPRRLPPQPLPKFAEAAALPDQVSSALETASPAAGPQTRPTAGTAVAWKESGAPTVVVWFSLPGTRAEDLGDARLFATFRSEAGTRSFVAPALPAGVFFTTRPGIVVGAELDLSPGNYSGSFAVAGNKDGVLATATAPIRIPDVGGELSVSSIVLSGGANPATQDDPTPFRFGRAAVQPRADARFLRSESLWFFFSVANPSAPENVTLRTDLRRGTTPVGTAGPSPAQLEPVGEGRYVSALELPLGSFEPGAYTLYVTVQDREAGVVRRADFQILPD